MGDLLKRILDQVKEIYGKLDRTKRIIVGVVLVVVIIAFGVLFTVSSNEPNVMLFAELSSDDFGQVTKKLDEMGYKYETSGTASIFVKPEDRALIVTRLAQENLLPKGIPGFRLFDISNWTQTDKELDVKFMRALRGEIQRHIESLQNISKADVEIAMSEDSIYSDKNTPYTAAVTVHLAPGYDKLSTKEIKGIMYLVSRAVGPRLKPEDVTVTDNTGK